MPGWGEALLGAGEAAAGVGEALAAAGDGEAAAAEGDVLQLGCGEPWPCAGEVGEANPLGTGAAFSAAMSSSMPL